MEYKLDEAERKLVLDTLHYVSLHAYEDLMGDSYDAIQDLIQKLDPKPVQRHGWMVVYIDGTKRGMFDTESEAAGWLMGDRAGKVVKVRWEE